MSTLYTSEKTHQQMLPQSGALECAFADNLKGKDETGRGGRGNPATGVQHGRAETFRRSPFPTASPGKAGLVLRSRRSEPCGPT